MVLITIFVSILLSIFSTCVMSYISMATPIGPWIAPTLVLIGMLLFKLLPIKTKSSGLALVTAAGSVGGILATAFGFSFPTLYFLDPELFASWLSQPLFFALVLSGLGFSAGGLGILCANLFEAKLIDQEAYAFPIGQLIYKMIAARAQVRKAYELMSGFLGTTVFCFLQDGLFAFKGVIPKSIILVNNFYVGIVRIPIISFDIWPLLWAIGFITGHLIAKPLAVGAIAKIFLIDPIHVRYFSFLSNTEFVLAFCSGMILYGACQSFFGLPKMIVGVAKKINNRNADSRNLLGWQTLSKESIGQICVLGLVSVFFLSYFNFSPLAQLYLFIFSLVCTYQIAVIAGRMGIAPLGRFATFVMLPAMFIFQLDFVQLVIIATFVEICGGVAADILFSRKMGRLAGVDQKQMQLFQLLGLLISCATIGIVFWLLITQFGLGSAQLFAYKAQSRQLLIHAKQFDYSALIIGAIFSFCLKFIRTNPMLVLGGLLMPLNISLGLIFGGICTLFVKNRQEWEPFWSGVFASNSLWMLIKTLI